MLTRPSSHTSSLYASFILQVYRRFQITFMSSSAALEFIDAIRTICPCKANPNPGPAHDITTTRTFNAHPDACQNVIKTRQNVLSQGQGQGQGNSTARISTSQAPPTPRGTYQSFQTPFPSSRGFTLPTPHLTSLSASSPVRGVPAGVPINSTRFESNCLTDQYSCTSLPLPTIQDLQKQASLPSSSPPTSSAKTSNTNQPHVSSAGDDAAVNPNAGAFLASLTEEAKLYSLPRTVLEQVIGDVVHEDGFAKLLENIDSMWGVKTLLGIGTRDAESCNI